MILRRLHGDERGVALITVLGLSLVLALLVAALLQYGVGSLRQARHDQDWHASLAAANAGVDDFLARLNRNTSYWQVADDDCDDCAPTLDPDNPALTGFVDIPGGESRYAYAVEADALGETGVIVVTATGRVNAVERTVRAELRRRNFLDYVYFTEYETIDPASIGSDRNCERHAYDPGGRPSGCTQIIWETDDTVTGPFHSNDRIAISGRPTWDGRATTSDPNGVYIDAASSDRLCREYRTPSYSCTSNPNFSQGFEFSEPLLLPPSNNQIKAQADPRIAGEGCMYIGATFIRLHADGSATIRSAGTDDPSSSKCPTDGTMSSLPGNGVIYVRAAKPSEQCLQRDPHPYDVDDDITPYDRCAGDAFVEGTLDGRLTIAAENNIVISDDLVYAGGRDAGSDDMLGLVANNFVEIMHPVRRTGFNNYSDVRYHEPSHRFESPHIDAAILSVEHSFRVQNYDKGNSFNDPIDLYGVIAQLYRGPVGTFNPNNGRTITGYEKDYKYDPRLEFISPPHFLDPVQSAWSVRSWSEETNPDE